MSIQNSFRRILVTVDGSENAFKACEVASILASGFKAKVTALCVIPPATIYTAPLIDEMDPQINQEARRHLSTARMLIESEDTPVKRQVIHAHASIIQAILEYAADEKSDLIVVGTRGLGGLRKMLLGSVSSGVAAHAQCSVLIARTKLTKEKPQFARVLVAVDGSECALKAAALGVDIARVVGTRELTFLHVVQIPVVVYAGSSASVIGRLEKEAKREGEKLLQDAASIADAGEGIVITKKLVEDALSPAEGITKYAEDNKADLIIVGTRGLGGFKRLLLGSVSSGVLGYAHCSVLVTR